MKSALSRGQSGKNNSAGVNPVQTMSFKSVFSVMLLACCSVLLPEQLEAGNHGLNSRCIRGTVRDSGNSRPLGLVEVQLLIPGEGAAVRGPRTLTDSNGNFTICHTAAISSIIFTHPSYKSRTISSSATDSMGDLGAIMLGADVTNMTGFGVKAKKEAEKIEVDKKTYVVSNSVLSTGGTAVDALRQIPAVNVDADGNVSLRGSSNVTIYINGKQSSLSGADRYAMLMQIPAANIESIDVNTNPGAKQDAEGMSGIINITLKQNTAKGRNGYVSAGGGNRNKYNATGNFNYNNKKWNFSNTLSFRQNDMLFKGYNERRNFTADTSFYINYYIDGRTVSRNYTLSGNVDYNATKTLILSANYMVSSNTDDEDESSISRLGDENDSLTQLVRRRTFLDGTTFNTDAGVSMRRIFDKPAHNLLLMLNYSATSRDNSMDIVQDELNTISEQVSTPRPYLLYNLNDNFFSTTLVQLDYVKPVQADKKLESGLKFTGRNLDNYFRVDSFDYLLQGKTTDSGKSNHFIYSENVSAAYVMLTHTVNDIFRYNTGLRVENTSVFGQQIISRESFVMNYTNLFPSGSINLTLQKKYRIPDIQLSYSRRINRPNQWNLNPFVSVNDPFNYSKGNPKLRPELTDALELSAYYNTKPVLITATVYFRQTNSPVSRYRVIDSTGISMTTFYNLDFNRSTGAELVTRFSPVKDLKLTLSGNLYKYVMTGNVEGNDFVTQRINYSGKANLNYTFWKKTEFQSSFWYMGPMLTPQGTIRSMYSLEAGVKKDIIRDKFSFSLTLADVFNNRRFNMLMNDHNFSGSFYRKRESRILTFNLTWKFGKPNNQPEKRPRVMETPSMDF
jgi:iron complex outermembrane receptor protein